ncbi:spore coat protein CotJB [Alicyclobacillaceae bacterium I2511]|nr:spore coat protein CotJB [Alicyclobacillaceae bacterium I2511]
MSTGLPKEYYRLLEELQTVDFVLLELSLYLDTHPDDPQAIAQVQQFYLRRQGLVQQFETQFGPLQEYAHSPTVMGWPWAEMPWPWQV